MQATLWEDYEIFDPQVERPLAEVTPAEARAHYALVMETKDQRMAELKKLARAARIELDDSEEALQRFNDWFVTYVKPDRTDRRRLPPLRRTDLLPQLGTLTSV